MYKFEDWYQEIVKDERCKLRTAVILKLWEEESHITTDINTEDLKELVLSYIEDAISELVTEVGPSTVLGYEVQDTVDNFIRACDTVSTEIYERDGVNTCCSYLMDSVLGDVVTVGNNKVAIHKLNGTL